MRKEFKNIRLWLPFLLLMVIWPNRIHSQNKEQFFFEASSGMAVGWWIYDHGSTQKSLQNNLGWDETRLSLFLPVNIAVMYHINRFKLGAVASYTWFVIDEIRKSGDAPPHYKRDPLSEDAVRLKDLGVRIEYDLVSRSNFQFGPHLETGIFEVETLYPERDNFGSKFFFESGINMQFRLTGGLWLNFRPIYKEWLIFPQESEVFHEKHRITAFGANLGLRYGW